MTDQPKPEFERPPVEEVALAVQFSPLELKAVHLGRIASLWPDYTDVEEHPAAPPMPEEPETTGPRRTNVQIQLLDGAPDTRLWIVGSGGTRVIQVQRDRLVHNWRRLETGQPYPHYSDLRPTFMQAFSDLSQFAAEMKLGAVLPTQCEVSYMNPIVVGEGLTSLGQLGELVAPWTGVYSDAFLPPPEQVGLAASYRMTDESSTFRGRLHVSVQPATRTRDGADVALMQVVARGRPMGSGLEGVTETLDLGHDWIVRGFASFTTKAMHERWLRKDDAEAQ